MKELFDWLDQRTGYRSLVQHALYENIPGGSRWRYVWGSTLMFALTVQFLTGLCLWMSYSPSSQTAWESVYFIQESMWGGWLLRGIHHYTASVMNVLLVLHLMQVVIDGAYRAPREINFWFGLGLLQLVLALSLTGYLLPWDQKGFWATKVATNIAGIVPVIGPTLQRVVIGGPDYGHHTLTRFFALHAGFLPASVVLLVVWHIFLFRRHGITVKNTRNRPSAYFWPDQVLKDAVACLAVMAAVLFLVLRPWLFQTGGELGAGIGGTCGSFGELLRGAAGVGTFSFFSNFLKLFPSGTEVWGAVVIPGIAMGIIFFMPIIGRWEFGHRFNLGLLGALLCGAGLLTYLALAEDKHEQKYQVAVREADRNTERVKVLARSPSGIPMAGAVTLLRDDPLTQGPKIFSRNCANCHRFDGHDGTGMVSKEPPAASDLKGFGSRSWLTGLLDPERISTTQYFGATKFKDGKMSHFVHRDIPKSTAEEKEKLRKVLFALSAEAKLKSQQSLDQQDQPLIAEGRALLLNSQVRCTECHQFQKPDEDATAPDLTGYASREWLMAFVYDSSHRRFYGKANDRMPAYGKDQILDQHSLGLVVDWLRGDWYEPQPTLAAAQAAGH